MLFRGTQRPEIRGIRKGLSYTTSLPAAIIWSSRPGDVFASDPKRRKPTFLPGSTIHVARVNYPRGRVLELSEGNYQDFDTVLGLLEYGDPDGVTHKEALNILQYLHNRLVGRAKGGDFIFKVFDEDWEEIDPADLPLSFTDPLTPIGELREEFEDRGDSEVARRLRADAFIFADSPTVQRVASRLGYEVLLYHDVFQGAETAAPELLGIEAENLNGVEMQYDLENELVPTHETYRILAANAVTPVESVPTLEFLERIDKAGLERPQ